MKLNYNLDADDYLNFQLYYVSKNEKHKKNQRFYRLSLSIFCAVLSIVSFMTHREIQGFYFLISTVICFFFYPKYAAWLYKRELKKSVSKFFKDSPTIPTTLEIENNEIVYVRRHVNSNFSVDKMEKIIELPESFLAKIGVVEYIIIPKNKLSNVDEVKLFFENLSQEHQLEYSNELTWKWS